MMKKEGAIKYQGQSFWQKYGHYFLPGGVILVIIFLTVLMAPRFSKAFEIRRELKNKEEKMVEMTKKEQELETIDLQLLRENLVKAIEAIPEQKAIAEVFLNLKILVEEGELFLEETSVNPGMIATEAAKVEEVEFKAAIAGTLEALRNFFQKLELVAPVVNVKGIEMSRQKGDLWQSEFSFFTFYSRKEPVFRVDSSLPKVSKKHQEMKEKLVEFESLYLKEAGEESGFLEESPLLLEREDLFGLP